MSGSEFDDNPFASPEQDHESLVVDQDSDSPIIYAGFIGRLVALIFDGIITYVLGQVIQTPFGYLLFGAESPRALSVLSQVAGILLSWLYYALQESSEAQATLGKRIVGIQVVDLNGQRISFARASGRHFAMYLSFIMLGIGFLMQLFTRRRQTLHDMLAGCLVIKAMR